MPNSMLFYISAAVIIAIGGYLIYTTMAGVGA